MSGDHGARPTPLQIGKLTLALALVVVGVLTLRKLELLEETDALFALGLLVVAGSAGGSIAAFFGLPRLTGYIVAGLLLGPQGSGLLSQADVKALTLINALALALIALQAGAELTIPTVRRIFKSVGSSAIAQIVLVVGGSAAAFVLLAGYMPFAADLAQDAVIALAVLWGTLSFTRSPSVTLAVISELKSKGPLTEHALGVVVLLDVLILPVFALALAWTSTQLLGRPFELDALTHLGHELFASFSAGVTFGLIVALLLRFTSERVLALIVLGYAVTAVSVYLRYDTLLVFVVAGFVVTNLMRTGPLLIQSSERTSAAVMIVFFATAGARLDIEALRTLWPVAVALALARAITTWVAVQAAHRVAGDPPVVRKNAWLTLISQAGVTIGLATVVAEALPAVGPAVASLAVAVVTINTLIGGPLMKLALTRAREVTA